MSGHAAHDDDDGPAPHDDHVAHDEEPWLVSYADMMTLLFGFFVLMYVFALAKLEKAPKEQQADLVHVRREIARHFGGDYVAPLETAGEEFLRALGNGDLAKDVELKVTPEGLDVTLQSGSLFDSGSTQISPAAQAALRKLAALIKSEKDTYRVVVEGHTDDERIIRSLDKFPSNWELSGARAAAVVRLFESEGMPPSSLVAVGYGASRPKVPNRDAAGQPLAGNMARNRRVHLKVVLMKDGKPADQDASLPIAE